MDTIRVDICYRPLRIGWAICSDDIDAFRQAVRLSHTLWGGRFNPILVIDREEEATQLIDLFRVDMILPIGDSAVVKEFPNRFTHLINPLFPAKLHIGGDGNRWYAQVLDIQNVMARLRDTPEWEAIKERGIRIYDWQPDDPLTDIFLIQLGMYPNTNETGIDYRSMLMDAGEAKELSIDLASPIPLDTLEYPTIAYFSRQGLKRHYNVRQEAWNHPGFFVGDATKVDDLVCHWNLRATDLPIWFIDPKHLHRYASIIPPWEKYMRDGISHRRYDWERRIAVWSRSVDIEEACKPFGDMKLVRCRVSDSLWNGLNVQAPMMHLGEASVLGVMGSESGRPRVSFALSDKPFCDDNFFYRQQLVASICLIGGLFGDEQHTFNPPYLPELNEFYARTMHFEYDKLRIEPGRIGQVIEAVDHDSFLRALPVADMMERIFNMAGYTKKLSPGGLIARQLISCLGGVQGSRVFKIPGVRRLLRTHGPTAAFSKRSAIQLIASNDPENPDTKFIDYQKLYIEPRAIGTKLNPGDVFAYLVEKGLFRIGTKLKCPNCSMTSWTALDALKQCTFCELCGVEYDATRQLVQGEWHYRRSGVFGTEKRSQGAIPVVLTLQQLDANLHGARYDGIYSLSLELKPQNGGDLPTCEIDFVWIIPRLYPRRTAVILGECKEKGLIDEKTIDNLLRVADAMPRKRFKTFVLLSKLCPFTPEEIERAKRLNDNYQMRAILLTARELEPYHIYDRTKEEFDIKGYGGTPEELAMATHELYFMEKKGD